MKSKFSKFRRSIGGSASGTDPARGQSNAEPQPEQSSGEQKPKQSALSPLTTSGGSRFMDRFRSGSPSPSLSPGIQRSSSSTNHSPKLLASIPTRPHSSCSGTTAVQILEPSPHTVTTMSSHNPGSSSLSNTQALPSTPPLNVPRLQILHPTTANEDPTSPSTFAPPLGPNVVIGSSPHSSRVWAQTLEIAEDKLREYSLPPLDLTTLTSESVEENIRIVVKKLNTLQEVNKEKQWSYTWRGKEVIVMERLGKILKIVDNYSKVVDTAIQSNPQVSALVWAGVRAIMQVRIQYSPPRSS